MKNSKKYWNLLAKQYDKQVNKKYAETYRSTIELTKKYMNPSSSVLDVGCGTGITTIALAAGVKEIHAIDASDKMIEVAKSKLPEGNIAFDVMDLFHPKLNGRQFDVVMAFNVLHFLNDPELALSRIWEMLPIHGLFISATDCLEEKPSALIRVLAVLSKTGLLPAMKRYTIPQLEETIESHGFSLIEKECLYSNPPNYFLVAQKN